MAFDLTPIAGTGGGATQFTDTNEAASTGNYIRTNSYARLQVSTTATSVDITVYRDFISQYDYLSRIGIIVNGAFDQSVQFLSAGASTLTANLPAGTKTVDFVNSGRAGTTGCWITNLSFNAAFTQLFPARTPKITVYGDSIATGDGAETGPTGDPQEKGWATKLRLAYSGQVSIDSAGSRTLNADASDSTKRTAFVAKKVIDNPSRLIFFIGTNDYGLAPWNAADFGSACATLMDDLHTALPSMQIDMVSPIYRTTETANAMGSTLQNYRDQLATIAAARPTFITFHDGTRLLSLATDFKDGLHPNGVGHGLLGTYFTNNCNGIRKFRATTS